MAVEITIDPTGSIRIVTDRLILREIEVTDRDALSSYLPELDRRRLILPGQGSAEAIGKLIELSIAEAAKQARSFCTLALVPKGADRLIGTCGFNVHPNRSYACLGWDLEADHRGKGFMPEAAGAMLDLAFGHFGIRYVISDTYMFNHSSRRVMEKIGMAVRSLSMWDEIKLARHYHIRRRLVRYIIYHNWPRGVVTSSTGDRAGRA